MSTALKDEIKKLARESVHEALQEELTLLRILHLPLVSKKEQQDINKLYKTPSRSAVRSVYVHV